MRDCPVDALLFEQFDTTVESNIHDKNLFCRAAARLRQFFPSDLLCVSVRCNSHSHTPASTDCERGLPTERVEQSSRLSRRLEGDKPENASSFSFLSFFFFFFFLFFSSGCLQKPRTHARWATQHARCLLSGPTTSVCPGSLSCIPHGHTCTHNISPGSLHSINSCSVRFSSS